MHNKDSLKDPHQGKFLIWLMLNVALAIFPWSLLTCSVNLSLLSSRIPRDLTKLSSLLGIKFSGLILVISVSKLSARSSAERMSVLKFRNTGR